VRKAASRSRDAFPPGFSFQRPGVCTDRAGCDGQSDDRMRTLFYLPAMSRSTGLAFAWASLSPTPARLTYIIVVLMSEWPRMRW
jgi:hypothetical protein